MMNLVYWLNNMQLACISVEFVAPEWMNGMRVKFFVFQAEL